MVASCRCPNQGSNPNLGKCRDWNGTCDLTFQCKVRAADSNQLSHPSQGQNYFKPQTKRTIEPSLAFRGQRPRHPMSTSWDNQATVRSPHSSSMSKPAGAQGPAEDSDLGTSSSLTSVKEPHFLRGGGVEDTSWKPAQPEGICPPGSTAGASQSSFLLFTVPRGPRPTAFLLVRPGLGCSGE